VGEFYGATLFLGIIGHDGRPDSLLEPTGNLKHAQAAAARAFGAITVSSSPTALHVEQDIHQRRAPGRYRVD